MATDARKMAPYSYLVLTFLTAGIIVYPHINFPDGQDNNTAILGNGSSPHIKIYGQYSRRIVSHNSGVITSLTKADSLYLGKQACMAVAILLHLTSAMRHKSEESMRMLFATGSIKAID